MEAGDTIKYGFFLPNGERYEVAELGTLREMYPTAHITHRVVSDGHGGSATVEFKGRQPYEIAAEKAAKARDGRRTEIRGLRVDELRTEIADRAPVPDDAKKDDLVEILIELEGVAEPEPEPVDEPAENASESETKGTQSDETPEEPLSVGGDTDTVVEVEKMPVSRDTESRSRR